MDKVYRTSGGATLLKEAVSTTQSGCDRPDRNLTGQ